MSVSLCYFHLDSFIHIHFTCLLLLLPLCFLSPHFNMPLSLCPSHMSPLLSLTVVAVSALMPSPSPLYPTTAQSLFIPPQIYLPSLSVYLSSLCCFLVLHLVHLSVSFFSPLSVNPTSLLSTVPPASLSLCSLYT